MYSGGLNGVLLGTYDITSTGNNQYQTFNINQPGVDYIRIDLNGSGAIDNIKLSVESTAIDLLDFRVQSFTQDNVTLVWETAAEIDNVGFNLYRSADANLANAQLIHFEPAAGSSGGHQYVYTDSIPNAGAWWYWLADVDTTAGETYHGPVSTLGMAVMDNFLFVPILATE